MTKNPRKLAGRLLDSGSIGDGDDDLGRAFGVLLTVAKERYGTASPRVICRVLASRYNQEAITAMAEEIDAD